MHECESIAAAYEPVIKKFPPFRCLLIRKIFRRASAGLARRARATHYENLHGSLLQFFLPVYLENTRVEAYAIRALISSIEFACRGNYRARVPPFIRLSNENIHT